jgi:4-hydroxy-tetrahydrodipicolinate reductase
MSEVIAVCVAGATGWTGRAVAEAVLTEPDLDLRSAVARSAAGADLGTAWGLAPNGVPVVADAGAALDGVDVLVDYTSHDVAKQHALTAVGRGVHVVIGSSGLTADDFAEIDAGSTPTPYVAGTLLAIRAAPQRVGLVRGLDTLLLGTG